MTLRLARMLNQTRNRMARLKINMKHERFDQNFRNFIVRTMSVGAFEVMSTGPFMGPEPRLAIIGYCEEEDDGT